MLEKRRTKARKNRSAKRARRLGRPWEKYHWDDIVQRDGAVCYLCETPFDPELDHGLSWSPCVDHVVPLEDDDTPGDVLSNVKIVHKACNDRKGKSLVEDLELPFDNPKATPERPPAIDHEKNFVYDEYGNVRYDSYVWKET